MTSSRSDMDTYTLGEAIAAWITMLVLIGATVAAVWVKAGTMWGLLALVVFAGATALCAATGNLINPDRTRRR